VGPRTDLEKNGKEQLLAPTETETPVSGSSNP
jgi:hypothetical protein